MKYNRLSLIALGVSLFPLAYTLVFLLAVIKGSLALTYLVVTYFVTVPLCNFIGLVLGIFALIQIKRTGEKGRWAGIVSVVLGVAAGIIFVPGVFSSIIRFLIAHQG